VTATPALRDLLQRMSADQRTVFAVGGLLAAGKSDVEIAKLLGVGTGLVRAYRLLVVQRAGRPEVTDAMLPERATRPMGPARAEAGAA
jgi:DNA-directed RNA polymerase specialized sigma24 family protein